MPVDCEKQWGEMNPAKIPYFIYITVSSNFLCCVWIEIVIVDIFLTCLAANKWMSNIPSLCCLPWWLFELNMQLIYHLFHIAQFLNNLQSSYWFWTILEFCTWAIAHQGSSFHIASLPALSCKLQRFILLGHRADKFPASYGTWRYITMNTIEECRVQLRPRHVACNSMAVIHCVTGSSTGDYPACGTGSFYVTELIYWLL